MFSTSISSSKRVFRSEEKPFISTTDGKNGTPVAIEVKASTFELCLPLGTQVIIDCLHHPAPTPPETE